VGFAMQSLVDRAAKESDYQDKDNNVQHLLGSNIQIWIDRALKHKDVQALQASFWTDLAMVYLEKTASDEKRIQDEPTFLRDSLTCSCLERNLMFFRLS
jgi:hypothetical protein